MDKLFAQTLTKTQVRLIVFGLILALAVLAPVVFKHSQFITGPIVNALIILATYLLGPFYGIAVSLIPSGIALAAGLLPFILWPMVGFIILGNIILSLTFNALYHKNYWLAATSAAILKFIWLYSTAYLILKLWLKLNLAQAISNMMGINQLFTALLGGLLAYLALKAFKLIK